MTIGEAVNCREFMMQWVAPHEEIMEWDKIEAVTLTRWHSVTAMLTDIAEALDHGKPIRGYRPEARNDRKLVSNCWREA